MCILSVMINMCPISNARFLHTTSADSAHRLSLYMAVSTQFYSAASSGRPIGNSNLPRTHYSDSGEVCEFFSCELLTTHCGSLLQDLEMFSRTFGFEKFAGDLQMPAERQTHAFYCEFVCHFFYVVHFRIGTLFGYICVFFFLIFAMLTFVGYLFFMAFKCYYLPVLLFLCTHVLFVCEYILGTKAKMNVNYSDWGVGNFTVFSSLRFASSFCKIHIFAIEKMQLVCDSGTGKNAFIRGSW